MNPSVNHDGAKKNDCERPAAKRLCAALYERHPALPTLLVEDALYANAAHLRQIAGYGWRYVLNVKPDSHASLVRQFAGRRASGQVSELRRTDAAGVQHGFAWTSGLCLCESAVDVRVNYLRYEQTDNKGVVTRWTWITNLPLSARTVERVIDHLAETKIKSGRPPKLSVEDQVLLTLEYWREYRTFFHIARNWGVHESSVWRTVHRVEDILTKLKAFTLPGKKQLQTADHEIEFIVVDVAETPIERPKKSKNATIAAKRSAIP